jgi:hypothetical protein
MAHELEPGRKLARHRGSFLESPAGSSPARQEGRASTRFARHAWSKARAPRVRRLFPSGPGRVAYGNPACGLRR